MKTLLFPLFVVTSLWLSTALSMESYKAEDGYEVFPAYNQSRYKLSTVHLPWVQALTQCQSDGGGSLLAVINSEAEADVIRTVVAPVLGMGYGCAWVGISDLATEGTWLTVQGGLVATSNYSRWGPNEPDQGTLANCGYVALNGFYYDWICSDVVPFICEKPNVKRAADG